MHTQDDLLDRALELFDAGGPRAVTMAAVARAARAPSGSLYHRFPDQPALAAALWLRTAERFENDYVVTLGTEPDAHTAVEASARTVQWCRDHPLDAALLHAGPRALAPHGWSGDVADGVAAQARRRDRLMRSAVKEVAAASGRPADEVAFAMFDLPLAVVRGHLGAGQSIPPRAVDRTRRLAARLLGVAAEE